MVNEQVNSAMVQLVGIQPGDLILEIGPGTGSLTKFLVEAGAHIIAVEKDQDMAALVAERFAHTDQVEVVHEDFVKWSVSSQINEALEQRYRASTTLKRAKVIANLPFNITTQVVKKLLPLGNTFSHVVLLLQVQSFALLFLLVLCYWCFKSGLLSSNPWVGWIQ
jgi:16S rRNA A1518/A1519 N6-dimethyltransferase RsmA/KsgA/DIM1 with predicted DNA glycosylase/AP lyase activity